MSERRWFGGFLVVAELLSPASAQSASRNLVIELSGFEHSRGKAIAMLFVAGAGLKAPSHKVSKRAASGLVVLTFANLPYGEYALIAFHDENGNGALDHNFLRLLSEPMAFSGTYKLSLFSGTPSFNKLKFSSEARHAGLSLELARL